MRRAAGLNWPRSPSTGSGLHHRRDVAEADRNIATAFLAGFVVRDLALVNHALELADHRQRIGHMLIAMLQMFAELDPPLFAPDAANAGPTWPRT